MMKEEADAENGDLSCEPWSLNDYGAIMNYTCGEITIVVLAIKAKIN